MHNKTTVTALSGATLLLTFAAPVAASYDGNHSLQRWPKGLILHIQNDGPVGESLVIDLLPDMPIGPPSFWENTPGFASDMGDLAPGPHDFANQDFTDQFVSSSGPSGDSTFLVPDPSSAPWSPSEVNPGSTLNWNSPLEPDLDVNGFTIGRDVLATPASPIPAPGVLVLLIGAGIGRRRRRSLPAC